VLPDTFNVLTTQPLWRIGEEDEEEELGHEKRDIRPDCGNIREDRDWHRFAFKRSTQPYTYYMQILSSGVQAGRGKLTQFFKLCRDDGFWDALVHVVLHGLPKIVWYALPSFIREEDVTVVEDEILVHSPTIHKAYIALYSYIEGMYRNMRIKINRKLTPSERSYWIGRHCLEKICVHLGSRKEYQVDHVNLNVTAMVIYYCFLHNTGRPMPIIDLVNQFDEEDMQFIYSNRGLPLFDAEGYGNEDDVSFKVISQIRSLLNFPFPFAGHIAIDSTSMV
jgi:hypothetical protein